MMDDQGNDNRELIPDKSWSDVLNDKLLIWAFDNDSPSGFVEKFPQYSEFSVHIRWKEIKEIANKRKSLKEALDNVMKGSYGTKL